MTVKSSCKKYRGLLYRHQYKTRVKSRSMHRDCIVIAHWTNLALTSKDQIDY